jgi:hypothetical protein
MCSEKVRYDEDAKRMSHIFRIGWLFRLLLETMVL